MPTFARAVEAVAQAVAHSCLGAIGGRHRAKTVESFMSCPYKKTKERPTVCGGLVPTAMSARSKELRNHDFWSGSIRARTQQEFYPYRGIRGLSCRVARVCSVQAAASGRMN